MILLFIVISSCAKYIKYEPIVCYEIRKHYTKDGKFSNDSCLYIGRLDSPNGLDGYHAIYVDVIGKYNIGDTIVPELKKDTVMKVGE